MEHRGQMERDLLTLYKKLRSQYADKPDLNDLAVELCTDMRSTLDSRHAIWSCWDTGRNNSKPLSWTNFGRTDHLANGATHRNMLHGDTGDELPMPWRPLPPIHPRSGASRCEQTLSPLLRRRLSGTLLPPLQVQ